MSDIKNLIRETNKTTRRGRMINNILWAVVVVLVVLSLYISYVAIDLKHKAEVSEELVIKERDEKSALLIITDSLKTKAETLVDNLKVSEEILKISEENLQGEKEKLEEIKIKYDSLRQAQLEQMAQIEQGDELWDYAVKMNTVQSYTDYINVKGNNDKVYDKLNSLLTRSGYLQIQESNGNFLIKELNTKYSWSKHGMWTTKSARSIRYGVMGLKQYPNQNRNGDVILEGQPFRIVQDSIMSGKTRWVKILY
jgi:hypothetical protein